MPRFEQRLSRWAESDLRGILDYTLATWGVNQLEKYSATLEKAVAGICKDPHLPRSKARDELFPGCRSLHVGRHLILYRVKGNAVEIARILYESMELERHIPPEFQDTH